MVGTAGSALGSGPVLEAAVLRCNDVHRGPFDQWVCKENDSLDRWGFQRKFGLQ